MASEAAKKTIRSNVHMDIRVIYASDLKFEVSFSVRDYQFITIARESIGPLPSC